MSSNLRAALTLVLKDELSAGLDRIKTEFEALKNLGRGLTLGHLAQGANVLREVASGARRLAHSLGSITGTADRAWGAIKRLGGAMGHVVNMQSRVGAFATVAQGYSVAAPIQQFATLEDAVRRIGIMKGLTGGKLDAEIVRLTKFFNEEGLATGQSALTGAATYLDLRKGGTSFADIEGLLAMHHRAATAFYADPEQFTPVTASLHNQFKIPLKEMEQALSAIGLAANLGRMTVSDLGTQFPRLAGLMSSRGLTGRDNANMLLAMLNTQYLTAGTAEKSAVQAYEGINYLYSRAGVHNFDGQMRTRGPGGQTLADVTKEATGGTGINLPMMMQSFTAKGINPVEGMLDMLAKWKANLHGDETKFGFLLNKLFGNQDAAAFWMQQLAARNYRQDQQARLNAVSPDEAGRMFQARYGDAAVQIKVTEERLTQLERRMGGSFLPVLKATNFGLETFQRWLQRTDKVAPGLVDDLGLGVGVLLSFGAAVGALGMVGPIFARGWAMVSPIFMGVARSIAWLSRGLIGLGEAAVASAGGITAAGALVAGVLVAAAADIYFQWDKFGPMFAQVRDGIVGTARGVWDMAKGFFTLNDALMGKGFQEFTNGALNDLEGKLKIIWQLLMDVGKGIEWLTGKPINEKIAPADHNPAAPPLPAAQRWGMERFTTNPDGSIGVAPPPPPPSGPAADRGDVHIYLHDAGGKTHDLTPPGAHEVHVNNAGRVLGRP